MDGLMPCVTTDAGDGTVPMLVWRNADALRLTIETGEAHGFSRTRHKVRRRGATSGFVQRVVEMRVDDDQDAVSLAIAAAGSGASCHVGYGSCVHRAVPFGDRTGASLRFVEEAERFGPIAVCGDAPNPTVP